MRNILQLEDHIKGLPDAGLSQMAQQSPDHMEKLLAASEIQRRTKMRKEYAIEAQEQPQGTIIDQTIAQAAQPAPPQMQPQMQQQPQGYGTAPQMPMSPQPPAQPMASGGLVRMAGGGDFPNPSYQMFPMSPEQDSIYKGLISSGLSPQEAEAYMRRQEIETPTVSSSSFGPAPGEKNIGFTPEIQASFQNTVQQSVNDARNPPPPPPRQWHEAEQRPDMPEGYITPLDQGIATAKNLGGFAMDRLGAASEGIAGLLTRDEMTTIPGEKGMVLTKAPKPRNGEGGGFTNYMKRVSDNIFGGNFGDSIFGLFDDDEEYVPVDKTMDTSTGEFPPDDYGMGATARTVEETVVVEDVPVAKPDPVDAEKKAQNERAKGLVVNNEASIGEGDNGGGTGDPDIDGLAGLVRASDGGKGAAYPGGISPYDQLKKATEGFEYSDLVEEARNSGLDVSELTKQARKDAWGAALMELGAGIAGGDFSKGLQGSSRAMQAGMQEARRLELMGSESQKRAAADARSLELQGRKTDYEQQQRLAELSRLERNTEMSNLLTKYGLDIRKQQNLSWISKNTNDEVRYQIDALKTGIKTIEDDLNNLTVVRKEGEVEALKAQRQAYIAQLNQIIKSFFPEEEGTDFGALRK